MFERFKRNRTTNEPAYGRTAVADRPEKDVGATSAGDREAPDERTAVAGSPAPPTTRAADDRPVRDELGADRTAAGDPRDDVRDDHDHETRNVAAAGGAGVAAGGVAGRHREREREEATGVRESNRLDERDRVEERGGVRRHAPLMETDAMASVRRRQRAEFGGMSWGSAFFGWLSATGLAAILTSILVAAGAAIGLNQVKDAANNDTNTIGLAGGIALLIVLAIAWYAGGYVAGRMARFDGARQGVAVWIWTLLFIVLAAVAAVIGGTQYDIANQLNLPSIPTGNQTLTTGGAIAAGAALLVTLLAAVVGGKAGDRFHRRVDRVATDHYDEAID